jgi:hypothetical protein
MSKSTNKRKNKFLESFSEISIESIDNDISSRSKFNFSYFDSSQECSYSFDRISPALRKELLEKLKEFSKSSLRYWTNRRIGGGRNVLEIYGGFPRKSEFFCPKHIPNEVLWGRFRLDSETRLVGFTIPREYDGKQQGKTEFRYDSNTFYIVFLDLDHCFYKL